MDADKVTKLKADLEELREALRDSLFERGLVLADQHPGLAFEVKAAIMLQASERAKIMARIERLTNAIDAEAPAAFGVKAWFIRTRVYLITLLLHEEHFFKQLERDVATSILRCLEGLIELYLSRSPSSEEAGASASMSSAVDAPKGTAVTDGSASLKPSSTPTWLGPLNLA